MGDLTFGELFAGVGGFSLGFEQAGWVCRWQVEWDRHCQQVLARHWPEVARYGDVTEVDGAAIAPVTCITFGSPCQDLSVAGKRAGLDGARSGLFYEAIRIIKEMRDATAGTLPRFAIWENVAGALSSNKGADFLAVLDAFAEIGAVDIAWRLVDAQHFGVPQRRRRVFVVADFGGECAGAIHAEPAGVRWHPASSRTAGEDVAGGVACGLGADSRIAGPLGSNAVGGHRGDLDNAGAYVVQEVFGMTQFAGYTPGVTTLTNTSVKRPEENIVVQPFSIQSTVIGRSDTAGPNGKGYGEQGDPMFTLDTRDAHAVVQPFVKVIRSGARDEHGNLPAEVWRAEQVSPTLNAFDNGSESRATVIVPTLYEPKSALDENWAETDVKANLRAQASAVSHALLATTVRRLTPLECERLNGFPDDHTRWRADGTEQSDSQRYRQMGNAVAIPCAAWLAWNLRTALETE